MHAAATMRPSDCWTRSARTMPNCRNGLKCSTNWFPSPRPCNCRTVSNRLPRWARKTEMPPSTVSSRLSRKRKKQRDSQAVLNAQQTQMKNGGMGNFNQQKTTQTTDNTKNGLWYFIIPVRWVRVRRHSNASGANVKAWTTGNRSTKVWCRGLQTMRDDRPDAGFHSQSTDRGGFIETPHRQRPERPAQTGEYYLAQIPFTERAVTGKQQIVLEDGLYNSGVILKTNSTNWHWAKRHCADWRTNIWITRRWMMFITTYSYYIPDSTDRTSPRRMCRSWRRNIPRVNGPQFFPTRISRRMPHWAHTWKIRFTQPLTRRSRQTDTREVNGNAHVSETRFPARRQPRQVHFHQRTEQAQRRRCHRLSGWNEDRGGEIPREQTQRDGGNDYQRGESRQKLRGGSSISVTCGNGARWFSTIAIPLLPRNSAPIEIWTSHLSSPISRFHQWESVALRVGKIQLHEFPRPQFRHQYHRCRRSATYADKRFPQLWWSAAICTPTFDQKNITKLLGDARTIIISEPNLEMFGTQFSYDDYDKFYSKHFAPLKISIYRLLTEPAEISTEKEPEPTPEEIDKTLDNGMFIDNGINVKPENSTDIIEEPKNDKAVNGNTDTNIILNQRNRSTNKAQTSSSKRNSRNHLSIMIQAPSSFLMKDHTKPTVTKPAVTTPTVTKPTITTPAVTKPVTKPQPKQPEKPVRQKMTQGSISTTDSVWAMIQRQAAKAKCREAEQQYKNDKQYKTDGQSEG